MSFFEPQNLKFPLVSKKKKDFLQSEIWIIIFYIDHKLTI